MPISAYRAALRRFDNAAQRQATPDMEAQVAAYCRDQLPMQVGVVNPELVFNGCARKGILLPNLTALVTKSPDAVVQLQWVR